MDRREQQSSHVDSPKRRSPINSPQIQSHNIDIPEYDFLDQMIMQSNNNSPSNRGSVLRSPSKISGSNLRKSPVDISLPFDPAFPPSQIKPKKYGRVSPMDPAFNSAKYGQDQNHNQTIDPAFNSAKT